MMKKSKIIFFFVDRQKLFSRLAGARNMSMISNMIFLASVYSMRFSPSEERLKLCVCASEERLKLCVCGWNGMWQPYIDSATILL